MQRILILVTVFFFGMAGSALLAKDQHQEPARGGSIEHEEHSHANDVAAVIAVTYETEESKSLFTFGGEYTRMLGSRFRVAAVLEHVRGPGAWVVVFPVAFRVWQGLWLSAGPGFEDKSRRSLAEGEAHHATATEGHGETAIASEDLEGRERFFLARAGAYYVFELGSRYSLKTGVAVDWVNAESGTHAAVVYGVAFGVGF